MAKTLRPRTLDHVIKDAKQRKRLSLFLQKLNDFFRSDGGIFKSSFPLPFGFLTSQPLVRFSDLQSRFDEDTQQFVVAIQFTPIDNEFCCTEKLIERRGEIDARSFMRAGSSLILRASSIEELEKALVDLPQGKLISLAPENNGSVQVVVNNSSWVAKLSEAELVQALNELGECRQRLNKIHDDLQMQRQEIMQSQLDS